MNDYKPAEIEPKWQKIWDETNVYTADLDSDKPKYIAMSMFNYPSGAGIHIGHAMNYTISDVKARFKRQQGYESYHPVGWDAFGLPAENYAIKAGVSPQESMATIIPSYHQQYKAMGWSNDWEKEISTHLPEYYQWTQWLFSEMYRHGLAYQDARSQWWCTKCQTVLANEQVIDGKCWRHDAPDDPEVEKREVKQWFFKITDYADELLEAIDELDWTDSVKQAQRSWIGRSEGAEIWFKVAGSDHEISVFTTRPDTIYGATFMVLAPESDLVDQLTTAEQQAKVEQYTKQAEAKSDVDRQAAKAKTGVFTGSYAINPATDEQIPIWVADYVLGGYGTGAIMAVPAHDQRDHEFAQAFDLPIVQVVAPDFGQQRDNETFADGGAALAFNPDTQRYAAFKIAGNDDELFLPAGGLDDGEDRLDCILRELAEEVGLEDIQSAEIACDAYGRYRHRVKKVNRHVRASFARIILSSDKVTQTALEDHEADYELTWVKAQQLLDQWQQDENGDFDHYIYGLKTVVSKNIEQGLDKQSDPALFAVDEKLATAPGVLVNSGPYDGLESTEAGQAIVADLAGSIGDETVDVEFTDDNQPVFIQKVHASAVRPDEPFVERDAITAIVKHWDEDKYIGLKWNQVDWDTLITGGVEDGQTAEEAAIAEIQEETGYLNPVLKKDMGMIHAKFFHVPKKENRYAHFSCFYFELANGDKEPISDEESKKHDVVWLDPEQMEDFRLPASQRYIWNQHVGKGSRARQMTNYKMRDWSVSRQRYWGAPIPIVNCDKCGPVLVPDEDLPIILPELDDFAPSGDGRSALARATDWLVVDCPECGGKAERETDTLDTYICSSWYMLRYFDPHNQQQAFSPERAKKWMPIDFYNGADHATAHLLYARFITRFFHKQGLVDDPEPFKQFLFNGKITASDGTMFAKSKGNGIDPLEIIGDGYGADALRMFLMFAAPLEQWAKWDENGVPGTFRFLTRLWNLVRDYAQAESGQLSEEQAEQLLRATHQMIGKTTADIESNSYNTAIASLMGNLNSLYSCKDQAFVKCDQWQQALEAEVACLAPFAPHIAEELWHVLGHSDSISHDSWPEFDQQLATEDTVTVVAQVNGKLRGEFSFERGVSEAEVVAAAKADPKLAKHLDEGELLKTIYIPDKLINFVIK